MEIYKVKMALRITTDYYDEEIEQLIDAAKLDLGIAGVVLPETLDAVCEQAIITYVKIHFGDLNADQYKRLSESYDAQKGQLQIATGYTDWGSGV